MDHLVCGDVGYGKTEVAMRAALKAVLAGKQVAVLAPTTILAEQHYHTFKERFAPFPVEIEMISRFKSKKAQAEIIKKTAHGQVDVLIGTHRLLQKDIRFSDIGLVIVDEEHRFGVRQKEALKRLRKTIDILTLTATPIPRTMAMAMGGVRSLSLIHTPPPARLPVETYIGPYDQHLVQKAVLSEISRGGQVFYIHDRVLTIHKCTEFLKKLLPGIRIGLAHGKLSSPHLEKVMSRFIRKEYDLLVSTTIVEAGLDIPNVNTMIIAHGHKLGLAQLYQLRGRIGRGRYKAYCYIFYPPEEPLSDEARVRLESISQYTDLGSGFKIALKDLQIRGAGNILGPEQHGHILEVGFDLYCKLLEEAIHEKRGIKSRPEWDVEVSLGKSAFIPERYILSPEERIEFYHKFASARSREALKEIEEEMKDRYGIPPQPVQNLKEIVFLKMLARQRGIRNIIRSRGRIKLEFSPRAQGDVTALVSRIGHITHNIRFEQTNGFMMIIEGEGSIEKLKEIMLALCGEDR